MALGDHNAADEAFLKDMIPHHRAALVMANKVLAEGVDPNNRTLARAIIDTQTKEIARMEGYLKDYGVAVPKGADHHMH